MASPGFEPVNLGIKGQHATPRPPKPIMAYVGQEIHICNRIEGFMTFVQNSLPTHVCHSATVPLYLYNKMIHRQTNSIRREENKDYLPNQ